MEGSALGKGANRISAYQEVLYLSQERPLVLGLDLETSILPLNEEDIVADSLWASLALQPRPRKKATDI